MRSWDTQRFWFESSVNSYGNQTLQRTRSFMDWFESSVNSYGNQTHMMLVTILRLFESSVNSYGNQTDAHSDQYDFPV